MANYYYYRTTPFELDASAAEAQVRELDSENEAILRFCRHNDWALPTTFCDEGEEWNKSVNERSQARALLDLLQEGDRVIIFSIQRMFSSCQDTLNHLQSLSRQGINLFVMELGGFITDKRFARDMVSLLEIFAGLERRRSAERIKQVKHKQRARGRYLGGSRPFGYMIHENGRLLEHPLEQRIVKRILALKQQGRSLRAIAAEVSTPIAPISFKTVQRVLQRQNG
ncbi:MAG: recombinase family protein [Pseudomonadales bacterium]|nr:recombinase family protein [Pseudomonadales bacterium]